MIIVNVCSFRCSIALRLCQIRSDSDALMHLYTCYLSFSLSLSSSIRFDRFPFHNANPFFFLTQSISSIFHCVCMADVPIFSHLFFPFFYYDVYFLYSISFYSLFSSRFTFGAVIVFCHCVSLLYLFLSSLPKRLHWVWIVDILCVVPMLYIFFSIFLSLSSFYLMWNDELKICFIYSLAYFSSTPAHLPIKFFAFLISSAFVLFLLGSFVGAIVNGFSLVVFFFLLFKKKRCQNYSLEWFCNRDIFDKSIQSKSKNSLFHLFIILIEIAHMCVVWLNRT